jgi:hypothetical protein
MNRYVFNVANRVFEIHIQSPTVPKLYETQCFEVLEGRLERRLIPIALKKGDVMQNEIGTELEVLLGARAFLQRHSEKRFN